MNGLFVETLSAGYGAVRVLEGVDLVVREGELVALLGTNGNGKSTLLNAIMGFVPASSGRVRLAWDGASVDLLGRPTHRIVELGIGFVPEGRRLAPGLTVEETLILGGSGRRAGMRLEETLASCYESFPVLKERRRQRAGSLSGGQQQLLAIARALMTSPRLLLVDEPSVGLAPIVIGQVLDKIRELQVRDRLTILMAEQSFFQTIEIATRAYVLAHGRITREFDRSVAGRDEAEIRAAMLGVAG